MGEDDDRRGFWGRSTTDLIILMITITICLLLLIATLAIGIAQATQPQLDLSAPTQAIGNIVNTIIGLAAGFLAGRTDRERLSRKRNNRDVGDPQD
jgi:hypothetical protein